MSRLRISTGCAVVSSLLATALIHAQVPTANPQALPPLLYVRLNAPAGSKVTVYRGVDRGQDMEMPVTIGLRAGYSYRLAISNVPNFPGQIFVPSLEIRGVLLLSDKLRRPDFPATLNFTTDDFAKVRAGKLLKKVIVLERPDGAIPVATRPEAPLEIPVGNRDPLLESRELGQPLAVMHLGERDVSPEELMSQAVPGTVFVPGDKFLPTPRVAPWVVWRWCPVYDPLLGPVHPSVVDAIPVGGDVGLPAGYGPGGKLRGLDPTDTVAEYVDSLGRRRLAVSNRVALCVPRFVILRGELVLNEQLVFLAPGSTQNLKRPDTFANAYRTLLEVQQLRPEEIVQRLRPSATINVYGTAIIGRVDRALVVTALRSVQSVDVVCVRPDQTVDLPLEIIKWLDKCGALVGDVVTFHLRYRNRGGRPINDVVVHDSLAPRFEYVAGSARSDREATFTTQPNDAGSTALRWEFPAPLAPGETGEITFQVRVR